VLARPPTRYDRAIVDYLTHAETAALIAAPDLSTWTGRRDHTLLLVAIHTGLRVSELDNLRVNDAHLASLPRPGDPPVGEERFRRRPPPCP